jgi:predicted kinase
MKRAWPTPAEFTTTQRQVFDGSMLGDGHLYGVPSRGRSSSYRVARCEADAEYLQWQYDLFSDFCRSGVRHTPIPDKRTGKTYYRADFSTVCMDLFTRERRRWYPDGKKVVPRDVSLTPLSIAVWFCDDGCLILPKMSNRSHITVTFATHSFTNDDTGFLCDHLSVRYNKRFNMYRNGSGHIIKASTDAATAMFAEINDHIPISMSRKRLWPSGTPGYMKERVSGRAVAMSGCSGSGKSTYAKKLLTESPPGSVIVSADDHFVGLDGVYRFDFAGLGRAHNECLRRYTQQIALRDGTTTILDNTNTTRSELDTYARLADAFGHTFEVITVKCDVEKAAARNRHGVPIDRVRKQAERIARRQLPAEWKHSEVESE